MKKILLATLFLISMSANAKQTLTINGTEVDKTVVTMTFSGDDVVLTFSDDTDQTVDMSTVVISFSSSTSIAYTLKTPVGSEMNIEGLTAGSEFEIYDSTGKMVINSKANGTSANISLESLKNGVYILKAGDQIVKFVKR